MSQKRRFPIIGSEPIKFVSKMTYFELKSQYLEIKMPRRGVFASITSNCFIGNLLIKLTCPAIISYLQTDFYGFQFLSDSNNYI